MRYEDMINGLAEEMLEKAASEIEEEMEMEVEEYDYEEEVDDYEEEVDDYEEEVDEEVDEEELEALAEELFVEELQKVAYSYEEEMEKEAGIKRAVKGAAMKVAP